MVILDIIAGKEYWGRASLVGRTRSGRFDVVAYFATGRSPPSRERRFDRRGHTVAIKATSGAGEVKGNPKLLFYDAIKMAGIGTRDLEIIATNGAQTNVIYDLISKNAMFPESEALQWLYDSFSEPHEVEGNNPGEKINLSNSEPDSNDTPRVNALLQRDNAAMCILLSNNGVQEQRYFNIPLVPGVLRMLPTYSGTNVPSGVRIPSFEGAPLSIPFEHESAQDLVESIYASLGPKQPGPSIIEPGKDMRVGVVAYLKDRETWELDYSCINMDDLRSAQA